jgi:ketosteroid isomerase-like protein
MRSTVMLVGLALIVCAPPISAHEPATAAQPSALPEAAGGAAATVDAFHSALRRGDTRAAAALLSDDALIFEEGGAERTKAEYAEQHLLADAEFSRAVASTVARRAGHAVGDIAWIASEGRATGTFRGRTIDSTTTETMVLRHTAGQWKIVHVHWSSRSKPAG